MRTTILLLCTIASQAHADARWYFRGGVTHVEPQLGAGDVSLSDVSGAAMLAIQSGPIAGSGVTASGATIAAAIVGYKLERRFAIETVLALPFTLKFQATGTLANQSLAPMALGFIPTGIPALGSELGEATLVPPLITAVYRPAELGRITPLVGAGLGLLFAYDAHVTNPVLTSAGTPEFSISPSAGLVLQAGLDIRIAKGWFARVDAKYIAFMTADATIRHIQVHTEVPFLDTVDVGTATMSVPINPIIVQAGVGADF